MQFKNILGQSGSSSWHRRPTLRDRLYSRFILWTPIGYHLSLNRGGRWGTTDDFTTSFLRFPLFSTALWDLANSRSVHSLMFSSHLFLCLPCLLPSPQWRAADAEIKVPSGENTELKRSPFKAWSSSVHSHTCYAFCQGFPP